MRLDRTNAGQGWRAWNARECREPALTFADDESHTYGHATLVCGPDGLPRGFVEVVKQAQCVRILHEHRLILINPIDDAELGLQGPERPRAEPWWRRWLGRRK